MEGSASKPTAPRQSGRDQTINVPFIGAPHVGLRALVYRICMKEYVDDVPYDPTGDHSGRKMVMAQQGPVILHCDPVTSGHFHALVQSRAARSDALVYVYSVADRSSFDHVQALCRVIQVPPLPEGPVIFVAASKADLPDWKVSLGEGREFCSSIGVEFLITSAKTGVGCDDDDALALVNHMYLSKARAEEERDARAANQAGGGIAKSVAEKSKVHLMVSRVVQRFKRLRDKQDPKSEDSTTGANTPAISRSTHKTQG